MTPWTPIPLALGLDLRFRAAPLNVRGLAFEIALRGGSVSLCPTAEAAARLLGDAEDTPALYRMLDDGLAFERDGRLWLDVPWPVLQGHSAEHPHTTAPSADAPSATPQRRPLGPSSIRGGKSLFHKREGKWWAHVPPEVTWEQWLASTDGQAWLSGAGAERRTAALVAARRSAATSTSQRTSQHVAAPLPPTPPLPEKNEENQEHTQSARASEGTSQRFDEPTSQHVAAPTSQRCDVEPTTPRCPTIERPGVDPEAALVAVRARAGKRMNLAHDLRSLSQWSEVVRGLASPSLPAFELFGDWVAAGGLDWWEHGRPSLAFLLRPGKLAELLDEAATWNATGRPSLSKRPADGASPSRPSTARVGPARASTSAEAAADAAGPDPLLALLHDTGS